MSHIHLTKSVEYNSVVGILLIWWCSSLIVSYQVSIPMSFFFRLNDLFLNEHSILTFLSCFNSEMPDRTGGLTLLLPVSKDTRTKEEFHKLVNGNSGDPLAQVPMEVVNSFYILDVLVSKLPVSFRG